MSQLAALIRHQHAGLLLLAIWAGEVLRTALPGRSFAVASQIVICVYLLAALSQASLRLKCVCAALLLATTAILWRWGSLHGLERGLEASFQFAAFFAALQFLRELALRIPEVRYTRLAIGRFDPAARKVVFLLSGHLIGAVFAAGSLFLLGSMVPASADTESRISNARSAVLGVGTAISWSPLFVAIALVASLTPHVHLWQLMLLGAPPAAILIGARCILLSLSDRIDFGLIWRALLPVQKLIVPLVATVAVMTSVTGKSNLTVVAVLVPCVALVAAVRRPEVHLLDIGRRVRLGLSKTREEVLLVSVALIVGHVAASAHAPALTFALDSLPQLPRAIYVALAAAAVFAGGFMGLHPLLATSLTLPMIQALAAETSPPILISAGALIGWSATSLVSVWAIPVLVASHSFRVPVERLSRGSSLTDAVLLLAIGITYIEIAARFL